MVINMSLEGSISWSEEVKVEQMVEHKFSKWDADLLKCFAGPLNDANGAFWTKSYHKLETGVPGFCLQ